MLALNCFCLKSLCFIEFYFQIHIFIEFGSIPKGMDISTLTDQRIALIQAKINRRPRAKLIFNTPKEEFFKHY